MEPMVLPTSLPKTLYFLLVVWKAELDSVFLCWAGPPSSNAAEAVRCAIAPGSLVDQMPGPRVLSLMLSAAPGCHGCAHVLEEPSWAAVPQIQQRAHVQGRSWTWGAAGTIWLLP